MYKRRNENDQISGVGQGRVYVLFSSVAGRLIQTGLFYPVSGEGFFICKVSGQGILFVQSLGAIIKRTLGRGEQLIVDNGLALLLPYTSFSPELTGSYSP